MSSSLDHRNGSGWHLDPTDFATQARRVADSTEGQLHYRQAKRGGVYLESKPRIIVTERTKRFSASGEDDDGEYDADAAQLELDSSLVDDDPSSIPPLADSTMMATYSYTFHVCYSASFRVPMLLIDGISIDDGQPVTIDTILKHLTPATATHHSATRTQTALMSLDALEESHWQHLTLIDHPHTGKPMYGLHPCHTATWMSHILRASQAPSQSSSPSLRHNADTSEIGDLDGELASLSMSTAAPPIAADNVNIVVDKRPEPDIVTVSTNSHSVTHAHRDGAINACHSIDAAHCHPVSLPLLGWLSIVSSSIGMQLEMTPRMVDILRST